MTTNIITPEQYLNALASRLCIELDYSVNSTEQERLFASRRGGALLINRLYVLCASIVDGAAQTPETLESFVNGVFDKTYPLFYRGIRKIPFIGGELILVPIMVSASKYTQEVIERLARHENRNWRVFEFPTLVETVPFRFYHSGWPNLQHALANPILEYPAFYRNINNALNICASPKKQIDI